ncbi:MAG: hypothetical protein Q9159_002530 [Coniocarpon cinnabarinum]
MPQRYKDSYPDAGASASLPPQDPRAFLAQYEEVDRASENLAKSVRIFGTPNRRESMPWPGPFARQYPEFDPRVPMPSRHHSISGDFDGMRSHSSHSSSSVQGYLAHQRFPPRVNEQEHLAKRRAAAQRERDLRNYHQEQQYNRNAKPERSQSPNGMSEEDRRELIARQHRALYGNDSNLYLPDGSSARPISQDARVMAGAPGPSPMNYDGYGAPPGSGGVGADGNASGAGAMLGQPRSRSNSTSSPAANQNAPFAMYESAPQTSNPTSSSSPGASPTRGGSKPALSGGVAPIGTRPLHAKRNTPPMPSPLSHGYAGGNERSQSSASNPTASGAEKPPGLGWGNNTNNGPWGNNKTQAPVWG